MCLCVVSVCVGCFLSSRTNNEIHSQCRKTVGGFNGLWSRQTGRTRRPGPPPQAWEHRTGRLWMLASGFTSTMSQLQPEHTHTSNPRTAKSISDSVTNVTCKNLWPTDVSGKLSHCADFKTANTQNLTFNIQTQRKREEHDLWTQRVKLLKMLPVERRRYTDSLSKALHIVTLGNMSPGDIKKTNKKKLLVLQKSLKRLKPLLSWKI